MLFSLGESTNGPSAFAAVSAVILEELWEKGGMLEFVEQQVSLAHLVRRQRMPEIVAAQQIRQPSIAGLRDRHGLIKLLQRPVDDAACSRVVWPRSSHFLNEVIDGERRSCGAQSLCHFGNIARVPLG